MTAMYIKAKPHGLGSLGNSHSSYVFVKIPTTGSTFAVSRIGSVTVTMVGSLID